MTYAEFKIALRNFKETEKCRSTGDQNDTLINIKAAPWDDINFRFYYCTEVVYPTDHVLIFFRIFIFLQIFLINISIKPEVTQTNYLYT